MLTVTKDVILPATITGSWPRPRWFDQSMMGQPLDTCMMDTRYREKFGDAMTVVVIKVCRIAFPLNHTKTFRELLPISS